MTGCTLPRAASTPAVYDFGPGTLQTAPTTRIANLPPLEFSTPQTSTALNSTTVLYRLGYADAQQLKPYTLARWSMPPAQLIGQRLRAQLGARRAIVAPGDIALAANAAKPVSTATTPRSSPEPLLNLHLELEEFSQLFDAPDKSSGVLRLRATLTQRGTAGEILLAQRSFITQQAAPTADASGGVKALTAATDQVINDIEAWLAQVERADKAQ
ncbi:MAG: ABC-type transport auxiliary lipoprotein family protein [Rhodoferax sp.]|uniref:ABC-type transport auxiliary lipoprotein family protein n=1 Tax=Rhodoferax sp. TaxID=50421 RepID=UPI00261371C2|nr:ABC-type transport auxiliary lipoprotein family protein [Rhodoferax sp.]MDD2880106.1 ABC-type transport auxiliary lipoprotein family protein [Rhodoferax sp.]